MNIKFYSVSFECSITYICDIFSFLPLQRQYHSQIDNLIEETVKEMITLLVAKVQNHTKIFMYTYLDTFFSTTFDGKYFTLTYTDLVDSGRFFFWRNALPIVVAYKYSKCKLLRHSKN